MLFREFINIVNLGYNPLDDSPEVWLDGNKGIGEADDTRIDDWTDQSGNSNTPTQSVTNDKPFHRLNEVNGHNAVDFDGTDEHLESNDAFQSIFRASFTIVIVFETSDGQRADRSILYGAEVTGTTNTLMCGFTNIGKLEFRYRPGSNLAIALGNVASLTDGANSQHIVTYRADSVIAAVGGLKIYFDGDEIALDAVSDGDTSGLTFADYTSTRQPFIGAQNISGADGRHYIGTIAELLLYSSALTDAQLTNIHLYLKCKYGIS